MVGSMMGECGDADCGGVVCGEVCVRVRDGGKEERDEMRGIVGDGWGNVE